MGLAPANPSHHDPSLEPASGPTLKTNVQCSSFRCTWSLGCDRSTLTSWQDHSHAVTVGAWPEPRVCAALLPGGVSWRPGVRGWCQEVLRVRH